MAPSLPSSSPPRFERPWGWFENLGPGSGYLVKRLWIAAGRRISLLVPQGAWHRTSAGIERMADDFGRAA